MYSIRYSKQHIRALQMRPLPKKKTDEVEVARARNEHPPRSQVLTQLQGIHTCTAAEGKSARAIITHTHISVFRRQTCSSFCLLHHHFLGSGGRRSAVPEAAQRFFCSEKSSKGRPLSSKAKTAGGVLCRCVLEKAPVVIPTQTC